MNQVAEWIKTARQIRDGIANQLSEGSPEVKEMIAGRMKHCAGSPEEGIPTCEYFSHGEINALVDGALNFVRKMKDLPDNELAGFEGKKCAKCGCNFKLIVQSPDKTCPDQRW